MVRRIALAALAAAGVAAPPAQAAFVDVNALAYGYRGVWVAPNAFAGNYSTKLSAPIEPMDVTVWSVGNTAYVEDRGLLLLKTVDPYVPERLLTPTTCTYTVPLRSASCTIQPYLSGIEVDGGLLGDKLVVRNGMVDGHEGDDTITTTGGGWNSVSCGGGTDTVIADEADVVAGDCENVTRA